MKEGSLSTSRASNIPDEVFSMSLKSTDCVNILFSFIKNVESQITQIFENTKEMKEGQIKGKKQLAELMEAISFFQTSLMNTRKIGKKRKKELRLWKTA